jgi:hypothetical protein
MYIMIGVSTFLIVLWGIITVLKYKVQQEQEMSQQQDNQNDAVIQEALLNFSLLKIF